MFYKIQNFNDLLIFFKYLQIYLIKFRQFYLQLYIIKCYIIFIYSAS
jgi:hypothetical protein